MAAAERRFAELGFEATRLEDIASEVGIRRAAIFYYFRDKQELYAAVLDGAFRDAMASLPSGGSVVERIEAAMTGWIDYIAERPSVARLILREAANARPGAQSTFVRAGSVPFAWFRALIEEGVSSGALKPRIEPHRLMSLVGAVTVFHFAAMPWLATLGSDFEPWSRAALDEHKHELLIVARNMLGVGGETP